MHSGQYKKRWRSCLHLHPNTHRFNQILQQSRVPVLGGRRAGTNWGTLGALYRQHQQTSTPEYASSRCAKKGMHTGRDFAVRMRYGGSFPNCGGRADRGGFGAGEHRRGPVCCPAPRKAMAKPPLASGPMHVAWRPHTWGDISRMERPQQNQQSAGGARQTYSENGCR